MGGRELARLGVPSDRLQPVYTIAKRGCAQDEKGAQCLYRRGHPRSDSRHGRGTKVQSGAGLWLQDPGKGGLLLAQAEGKGFEITAAAG